MKRYLTALLLVALPSLAIAVTQLPSPSLKTFTIQDMPGKFTGVVTQWPWQLNANGSWTLRQPAFSDLSGGGTGVATALGVNVGSVGAIVVNGGALGAPSSGDASSLANLNASALAGGTTPAARMPAFTGSCTTTVGTVALTCEQDGARTSYSPTISSSGTLPTTQSATMYWIKDGSRHYTLNMQWTVTTVGSGSAGFYGFTLPNGSSAIRVHSCSPVITTGGVAVTNAFSYANSTSLTVVLAGAPNAVTYVVDCEYESTT